MPESITEKFEQGMSYKGLKRLIGENNLERKCRLLLGVFIALLMTAAFWLYARQTEELAYDQTQVTGQLLVPRILAQIHLPDPSSKEAIKSFQEQMEVTWPESISGYRSKLLLPNAKKPENQAEGLEASIFNRFVENPGQMEYMKLTKPQSLYHYYGAVRALPSCINCHNERNTKLGEPPLNNGDLMAVVAVRLSTKSIESGIHQNRAMLISTALVSALLIMLGSYLIIRYVIVKPLRHLKEVSDAISEGKLNVRSDIQTGDEFESLSDAFNRMLRKLMTMQEEANKLNQNLDRKVDELARANMALHESDRIKGDFLATMSHELRTPLNSILGFSDVLLSQSSTLTEKQARWITNIRSNGQQLLTLINDILDLAKIEAGKLDIRCEEVSLVDFGDNLLNMFRPMAEKKRIELRTRYETPLPLLKHDTVKLRQILSNLLSNAIKFSPEAGRVELGISVRDSVLTLVVSDNGIGIPPEDQEAIFEKFRQAGKTLTREHEGSGLGLSIVHELCKLLGGSITVRSEVGQGSTFTVILPTEVRDGSFYDFVLPGTGSLTRGGVGPTGSTGNSNSVGLTGASSNANSYAP